MGNVHAISVLYIERWGNVGVVVWIHPSRGQGRLVHHSHLLLHHHLMLLEYWVLHKDCHLLFIHGGIHSGLHRHWVGPGIGTANRMLL